VGTLVAWLGSTNDTATPQFLRDRYSSLPDESARTSALRALIDIGTTQSLQTLGELLLKPSGPDASELYDLSTAGIDSGTTGALYPAILSLLEIESYQEPLYRLTSLALDSGIITPETLIPHRQLLLSSFSAHLGELASNGDTEESRMELGWKLTALIDCLGHLPAAADMDTLLLQCATQADVPIATAAAAAIALLQHGVAADTPAITNVLQKYAAQPENRAWLYRWMASNGVVEHFPRAFQTPVLFAESNLAEWLEADDGPPTFIELLAERNIRWEGKDGVGYLFRFTWDSSAAEASWNAGLVVGDPAASLANQPDPEPTVRYEYESLEELTNDEKIQYFLIRE